MPASQTDLQSKKAELEKERDKIKAVLARRAKPDPKKPGNFITQFPNTGDEIDDEVFEDEQYEVNLDIEHVLEKRLKKIEEDLAAIAAGTYTT